jgi:two-component system, response regulator PdtaR
MAAERPVRVVLGEDDVSVRTMLVDLLGESGFDVVGAGRDGREATELALRLRPDVVLLDVRMPVLNGIDAAQAIHDAAPGIRIVMHSACDDLGLREEAFAAGAETYLVKGVPLRELTLALRGEAVAA